MMHQKKIITSGKKIAKGGKVLIMIHGRGGSAEDILSLSAYLPVQDFSMLAPQAANNTWYPFSFMVPQPQNEPALSSALSLLSEITAGVEAKGVRKEEIYFLGFSQGACLTLEYVTRNAAKYGGVVAFTGGLIGDHINRSNYTGDFGGTPVFIGTSDPDPHVPVHRVEETAAILKEMHAAVTVKIYPGMGHTITADEIEQAKRIVF